LSRGGFLFGLWCLLVTGGFLASIFYAWSPFADGGRTGPRGAVFVGGPRHK
jgi:hypothetical protein